MEENYIYYIENEIDEFNSDISGYFKTYQEAYEALKKCANWFHQNGTGQIWKVRFGLHGKKECVYDSYDSGPAK